MGDTVIRGRTLSFARKPQGHNDKGAYQYSENGAVGIRDGIIHSVGDFDDVTHEMGGYTKVIDHRPHLIMPGFIDAHAHFPQMQVIASYGTQLIDWLNKYTFPEEMRFEDHDHSKRIASLFLDTSLRHGTTTIAAYSTAHKNSASALFDAGIDRNMRLITGKTMMDRNAPEALCDTPISSYEDSRSLLRKYHNSYRLHYAITPRFAITSSPEQLEMAAALKHEFPGCHLQTHLSENLDEIAFAKKLYPSSKNYLDIYASYELLSEHALMGHCIHLDQNEIEVMADTGAVAVFCPTSNLFLGSGLFPQEKLERNSVRIAMASDTGGGTNFSMLRTADEGYKVQQLQNNSVPALNSFYQITFGNAKALSIDEYVGTLQVGREADLVVLDAKSTLEMALRYERVQSIEEELFLLQTLGDDRAVIETYVYGEGLKSKIAI